ncbi:DUF2971 domain-containing protein [Olivibacter sp. SA151]|uniref:DUF2971 domain-containing protein n=1 Tax=Olivibacter jilunii TaxID=985016 RepID=UPI003F1444C3
MQKGIALPVNQLKLPDTLYKFRDFNNQYHKDAIQSCKIYIPSAKEFNDPYDCNLPFRYRKEDLTEENIIIKANKIVNKNYPNARTEEKQQYVYDMVNERFFENPDHLKAVDEDSYDNINREFGVFCLTPKVDNLLMWSYYANCHRGFAIGYNPAVLLNTRLFNMGGMVDYTAHFPEFPFFYDNAPEGQYFANVFFKKSDVWKHEVEYRLLHIYNKGKLHPIPVDAVNELVYGVKFGDKEEIRFTELLIKKYPHIKVYKMELDNNQFGLKKTKRF